MKKTIFTLAAAAMLLAGCAKTEVTEKPEGMAINFSNFVTNSVKSIDDKDALTTFYVYGGWNNAEGQVFENKDVNKNGSAWTYTPTVYWVEGQTYSFAAYSDNNGKLESGVSMDYGTKHLTIENYKIDAADEDLIYATAANNGTGYTWTEGTPAPTVDFTFKHILSKVNFSFTKAADLNGMDVEISDITVNVNSTATFTGTDITGAQYDFDCWSAHTDLADFVYDNIAKLNENGEAANVVSRAFIPQGVAGYKVKFNVTYPQLNADGTFDNGGQTQTRSFEVSIEGASDQQWKPGYVYNYAAEIKASNLDLEPIVFTVDEVGTWTDETIGDIVGEDAGSLIP